MLYPMNPFSQSGNIGWKHILGLYRMLCSSLTLLCCFNCITSSLDWSFILVNSPQPQTNCVLCSDPIISSFDCFTAFVKSLWSQINWVLYSDPIISFLNHLILSTVLLANLTILTPNSFFLLFCRLLNLPDCLSLFLVISFSHHSV